MPKKIINFGFLSFCTVGIFAILQSIVYYNYFIGREVYLSSDDAIYALLSQKLLAGDFASAFNPYWNAGFPLATIPFYLITQNWETAQILVSMASHILLIFVMYFGLRSFSRLLALTVAFVTAFSPSFTRLVVHGGITEPFYVLLLWMAIFFGWQAIKTKGIKWYALAGVFFGLSYLTRTEVIYTLSIFLLFTTFSFLLQRRKKPFFLNKVTIFSILGGISAYLYFPLSNLEKFTTFKFLILRSTRGFFFGLSFLIPVLIGIFFEKRKTKLINIFKQVIPRVGILIVLFLLVNLPYAVTISKNLGKPTLSGKYAFLGSGHPFTPEKDRMTTWAQDIWSLDFPNYGSPYYNSSSLLPHMWKTLDGALEATWGKKIGTNLNFYAHGNIFQDWEYLLGILGFVIALLQPRLSLFTFYLLVLWSGSLVFVSHFMDVAARYLAFSFPLFYIGQTMVAFSLGSLFPRFRKVFLPVALLLFAAIFFSKNVVLESFYTLQRKGGSSDQKEIGDWLKSQGISLIMARTEGLTFYSGAKIVYMPAANPETIVKFAKAWGVEYLVSRPVESSWDYMRIIATPNFKHPDLELKHKFKDGTLIWKVKLTEEEKLHNFRTTEDVNKKFEDININSQTILKR